MWTAEHTHFDPMYKNDTCSSVKMLGWWGKGWGDDNSHHLNLHRSTPSLHSGSRGCNKCRRKTNMSIVI